MKREIPLLRFKNFIKEAAQVHIAPHGGGAWTYLDKQKSEIIDHPTEKTVGNEPFKDKAYFRSPDVKQYANDLRKAISKKKEIPPVLGTEHPADSSVQSVIDGNHRRQAAANARVSTIPVEKVPHDKIRLLRKWETEAYDEPPPTSGIKLSSLRKKDGSYDMNKPQKKLGGLAIKHYFVNPDGSHNFNPPEND